LLYAYDLSNKGITKYSEDILEENKIRNRQREFSLRLFNGTVEYIDILDEKIQKHLESWDYTKIGKVEKAILRLASYEIIIEKTDKAIIINEAIELAKELADDNSPKFINGVLDAIAKEAIQKDKNSIS